MSNQIARTFEDESLGDSPVTWEDVVQASALFEEQHADDAQYYPSPAFEGDITYIDWLKAVYLHECARYGVEPNSRRGVNFDEWSESFLASEGYYVRECDSNDYSNDYSDDNDSDDNDSVFEDAYESLSGGRYDDEEFERIRIENANAAGYNRAMSVVMSEYSEKDSSEDSEDEFDRMRLENEVFSNEHPLAVDQLARYEMAFERALLGI